MKNFRSDYLKKVVLEITKCPPSTKVLDFTEGGRGKVAKPILIGKFLDNHPEISMRRF